MWENPEDPARYLADRLRAEHALPARPTLAQLEAICAARGCTVLRSPELLQPGYYLITEEGPLIALQKDAPAEVLAHELYHHLVSTNREHGILYTYPAWIEDDEEAAAARFARRLCGEPGDT